MHLTREIPALRRLDALVGTWETKIVVDGRPMGRGRTTFGWLEGGAFLVQLADDVPTDDEVPEDWLAHSPMPVTTVIGLDDSAENYSMLYSDARGVFRVYQMSLTDGVWKLWREAPGFSQRFTGTFSADDDLIGARWEMSRDGSSWTTDFDMTYTKVS